MNDTPTTLLVAEGDDPQREFYVDQFLADGFAASGAEGLEEARVRLASFHPDLLVLGELEGPREQLGLLRGIRSRGLDGLPVLVLSSDASELAQLRAFEAGCDDYLPKAALTYPLLLARVRALVRRSKGGFVPRRRIGALEIDQLARRATVAERPLTLSRIEFDLLAHLAAEPTKVFTKWELLRDVWGYRSPGNTRSVDAHACRLRKKLAVAGAPHLIANVRGVGYKLSIAPVAVLGDAEVAEVAATNGRAA